MKNIADNMTVFFNYNMLSFKNQYIVGVEL